MASFTGKASTRLDSGEKMSRVLTGNNTNLHDLQLKGWFSPDRHSAFENANFSKTASC